MCTLRLHCILLHHTHHLGNVKGPHGCRETFHCGRAYGGIDQNEHTCQTCKTSWVIWRLIEYSSYKCWSVRFLMSQKCAKVNVWVDIESARHLLQYCLGCMSFLSHFLHQNHLFDLKHKSIFTTLNWSMVWPLWDSSFLAPFRNKVGLVPSPK